MTQRLKNRKNGSPRRRGREAGPQAEAGGFRSSRAHRRKTTGSRPRGGKAQAKGRAREPRKQNAGAPLDRSTLIAASGILELHPKGYGFLRDPAHHCRPSESDPYVPLEIVESYLLRQGSALRGLVGPTRRDEGPRLQELHDVDAYEPDKFSQTSHFDSLTAINPESWLRLETGPAPISTRVIDLLIPIGKGQRGLIVAPPRTGKTILLQEIGQAVAQNHPDVHLMVLLVDERPEEVTEMSRNIPGDVFASNLDQEVESHIRLSRLVIDRAMRLAEQGKDVVVLIDSITRMARAFNKWTGNTGRTMSGGLDIRALDIPKQLFASARAFEEGGSLTILATALVETGSRMDDMIFEEFKGTGNLEIVLDRQLAERRVWPAVDVMGSGTRREEKLLDSEALRAVGMLRRTLSTMHPADAMQRLSDQLTKYPSNAEFLQRILRQAA